MFRYVWHMLKCPEGSYLSFFSSFRCCSLLDKWFSAATGAEIDQHPACQLAHPRISIRWLFNDPPPDVPWRIRFPQTLRLYQFFGLQRDKKAVYSESAFHQGCAWKNEMLNTALIRHLEAKNIWINRALLTCDRDCFSAVLLTLAAQRLVGERPTTGSLYCEGFAAKGFLA